MQKKNPSIQDNRPETFKSFLKKSILRGSSPLGPASEPFASWNYKDELKLKQKAIDSFLGELGVSIPGIVQAPEPRKYRTTTKRRVQLHNRKGFSFALEKTPHYGKMQISPLEPDGHTEIYLYCFELFQKEVNLALAKSLQWVIIRSSRKNIALIFNVVRLSRSSIKQWEKISAQITVAFPTIQSVGLFHDPTASDYYFEANTGSKKDPYKNIWGNDFLNLEAPLKPLRYPVTGFTQVNEAFLPQFISIVKEMLQSQGDDCLLELYSGYGLFTFHLAEDFRKIYAVELDGPSAKNAQQSVRFFKCNHIHFAQGFIDQQRIKQFPKPTAQEVQLLDPPRHGTLPGVIDQLAMRNPKRAVQIYCSVDRVIPESTQWINNGYQIENLAVLDLFPGTDGLEVIVSYIR